LNQRFIIMSREVRLFGFVLWLCSGLFAGMTWAAPVAGVRVQSLHYFRMPTQSRLVFDTSAPVTGYKVFSQTNPNSVVIDVAGAVLTGALPNAPANDPLIRGVHTAPGPKGALRLVVDLKAEVKPSSHAASEGRKGHRLVIDLAGETRSIAPPTTTAPRPAIPTVRRPETPGATIAAAKAARQAGGDRAASRPVAIATRVLAAAPSVQTPPARREAENRGARDLVVAIDAGHGGGDPGAHGSLGTDEKDVTLAIARKLENLIRAEPGMKAVMIRNGDHYLGLRERIQKARKHKADLFVSIHADAFINDAARGSSVFTLSEHGASSEAARWLAERENAADLVGGVRLGDKDDVLASVLLDLSQTATLEASHEVAGKVLGELGRNDSLHHRDVQRAGFVVLKSPDIPSILVETAFISNPDEERKLRDPARQEDIARAVFRGVRNYFALRAPSGTRLASR
jgi:N-acetylmuramoyl-L-alanine amidase